MTLQEKLTQHFAQSQAKLDGQKRTPIQRIRQNAIEDFEQVGFPNTKTEQWKYTSVRHIANNLNLNIAKQNNVVLDKKTIKKYHINQLDCLEMVFVDGFFMPQYSNTIPQNTIVVDTLANALKNHLPIVEQYFNKHLNTKTDAFAALNTALAADGAFVYIPKNITEPQPIHIVNISTNTHLSQNRNLIVVETNANAQIIETNIVVPSNQNPTNNTNGLTNNITEIFVNQNATLTYHKLNIESQNLQHIGTTQIYQETDSTATCFTFNFEGDFVRNNLNAIHNGTNCTTNYWGLSITDKNQLVDNHTLIDHATPHCQSNETYKTILADASKGVFNGKVLVRQDAQKTNAYQSNKNIVLSKDATINAKPELEIFADDVKCSHGATIGQLNANELFYMQTRGIDKKTAQQLLLVAFANDVVNEINNPIIQNFVHQALEKRLQQIAQS